MNACAKCLPETNTGLMRGQAEKVVTAHSILISGRNKCTDPWGAWLKHGTRMSGASKARGLMRAATSRLAGCARRRHRPAAHTLDLIVSIVIIVIE